MVLESYRAKVQPYVARLARPYLGWDPGQLSLVALSLAVGAGAVAFLVRWTTPDLFLLVALLIFFSGFFDVLDGEVARETARASVRGDFIDHVYDRYADVAILLGVALSTYANPFLALLALVSLLLVSYMGTQAQAVGQGRLYGGLLSRADRLVVLVLVVFLEFDWSLPWPWAVALPWSRFHVGGLVFTVIDVGLAYFVIAGQWTAISRAVRVFRALPPSGSS
jgi:archaetidylinositol phosphate synthase